MKNNLKWGEFLREWVGELHDEKDKHGQGNFTGSVQRWGDEIQILRDVVLGCLPMPRATES